MFLAKLFAAQPMATRSSSRVVGIDIGSSSIKAVELENRDDVLTLTTYGELQLGPYDAEKPIGQTVALDPAAERQALVDVLRESAVKAKSAVFAMPLSASFVTIMNLQAPPEEDIAPRVRVEARKYIPVPIAEVTLDWAEIDIAEDDAAVARNVLLAAIQNEALKRFNDLMKAVNFTGAPTEIECFSTIRSLYDSNEACVAIIDVGATLIKLYIVKEGLLQRMYRVKAGAATCSDKIAAELDLAFDEAELLKRSISTSDPQFATLQKIHHNNYDRALREFKQVLNEYQSTMGETISALYLTGGGSLFPGLDTYIRNNLELTVVNASPFDKVAYPAFMEDTLKEIGPSFATALGAALRSFE